MASLARVLPATKEDGDRVKGPGLQIGAYFPDVRLRTSDSSLSSLCFEGTQTIGGWSMKRGGGSDWRDLGLVLLQ